MTTPSLAPSGPPHLDAPTEKNFLPPVDGPVPDPPAEHVPTVNRVPEVLERAWQKMPSAGEVAFGFALVRELGRGSYGRVFLATQPELAGRVVALKVSADLTGESRTLAQLQHTNIVPVYSVHRSGALQAVCMPYFGPTTLADVLKAHRARNHLPATGREFVNTLKGLSGLTAPDAAASPAEPLPARPANAESVFSRLSGLSYVRAVCWVAARLADGLAHAHDRGILHRDIKPANVLVTDDGQPMLLDFGIAEEMKARVVGGVVGGTLPYMAPESLDEILTGTATADARSDVYSLGVVLFELLTGQYPFRLTTAAGEAGIRRMAEERRGDAPYLRDLNPEVTPGLESIVRTCLAGDTARRYPSAALRDDLDHYLADEPLAVARERSVKERVAKWSRRHPRLTSSATLAAVSVGLLAAAGFALSARSEQLNRLEADRTYHAFLEQSREAHYLLFLGKEDGRQLDEGVALCRRVLAHYGALDHDDWDRRKAFTALPPDEQRRVRRELADGCVLMARGCFLRFKTGADPDGLRDAIRLNERAEAIAAADAPRDVFTQREVLLRAADRGADADAAGRRAATAAADVERDLYALALAEQGAGRHAAAVAQFRAVQKQDPKHYWAYYGEGVSHAAQGKWADARGCYTAAAALWPTFHWAYFNRGLVSNESKAFDAAEADFTRVIQLQAEFPDAYLGRALARNGLRDFDGALADLDRAAGLGTPPAKTAGLRAKLRSAAGLPPLGGEAEPDDEDGWVNRGLALIEKKDMAGAEAAFQKATEANPRSANALLFRVYALAEMGKLAECLPLLDRAHHLDPDNVRVLAGRGVARARLKQWAGARADAEAAVAKSTAASNLYQVAGVYARLSEHDPACRGDAVLLLGVALRAGFGFDQLAADPDLDPIRKTPEFEKLVTDVARFRPKP